MTAHRSELPRATTESTVSMRVVRGLVIVLERAGMPRAELLRAADLSAEQLEEPDTRLPRSQVFRICETAMDVANDPALGLHWAERLTPHTFGPMAQLIVHAGSLRQGFASLAQFATLLSDSPGYELIEHDDKVTLTCPLSYVESMRMRRFVAEMVLAGFFKVIRSFKPGAQPQQINFEYAAPDYHPEYTRVFGPGVQFAQPLTGIVFERSVLDTVSPHREEDVHEAMRAVAERRMSRLTQRVPYALRVRELLVQQGWRERVDMPAVARELGLSVRSLRRRLAAEGKSYADVENEALAIVAKHLLQDKQRTIQETAFEMGFSDTTAFHRAFKRWTGKTPSAFRKTDNGDER